MKKKNSRHNRNSEQDTMRPEYDFSDAVRGATAARYAQGANIAVIDPKVLDVFPDGATVNRALRALAPVLGQQRGFPGRKKGKWAAPGAGVRNMARLGPPQKPPSQAKKIPPGSPPPPALIKSNGHLRKSPPP